MKREVIFCLVFLLLISFISVAIAEDNESEVSTSTSSQSEIDKAYSCLENKVANECSDSLQDNIFTLLAIKKCGQEVIDESDNEECWPDDDCSIKITSQAILALDKAGYSTAKAVNWLSEQNNTPDDVEWYLEIESPKETNCEVSYNSKDYKFIIKENKKISSTAGSCLGLSDGNYWFKISPSCYDEKFEITCDEQFLTTLLFKKKTSSVIHVSEKTSSASAEGTTSEQVESFCFTENDVCDYEGTLWATLVLDSLGNKVSPYLPYLITMADDNEQYLPESFLYALTGYSDFRADLMLKQKTKYWEESGDKFYDTALALYPFQNDEFTEKANSKEWLLEIQGDDGCWNNGNIKSTAFILHSIWPRTGYISDIGTGEESCIGSGYYCMSSVDCRGDILDSYSCSGVARCCDTPKELKPCLEQGGELCSSNYFCSGGTTVDSLDAGSGEQCCIGGKCLERTDEPATCESNGGTCRSYLCEDKEYESFTYSCDYGDMCCVKQTSSGISWWIWFLGILIILIILAIVFRDKLESYYQKIKYQFKGKPKPGLSRQTSFPPRQFVGQRKILPPANRTLPRRQMPARKSSGEIDDVLKKLKEIGK